MKHLKKFESFVEQMTDDKINDFLNYKWNPNDPQIYRSLMFQIILKWEIYLFIE